MPQFANPGLLWLALLVPPLLWRWLRRPRPALALPAADALAALPAGGARAARWGGAALRGAALLALAVALAGPRWPDLRTRIQTEGIALVMLVDVSGSMAERDFDWQGEPVSRLEAARRAFRLFVAGGRGPDAAFEGRPTDQIGLITFATRPETVCPLTLSHSALLQMLDAEQPRAVPGESETNLSDAIALGLHRLDAAGPRRKVLVLLSDGEHNVFRPPSGWTPRQAASVAASLGVPIYAVDAGGGAAGREPGAAASASPGEVRQRAVESMQERARMTGGRYFAAHDTKALLDACRSIDALERSPIRSFQYRRYHEAAPWLALAAFVLLCTALGLDLTVWRRLP
jgi:Ca-activated chloride channel family protein